MARSISLIGTTSCGKSTIGNLIGGRYVLPVGVRETTTSVIELRHDRRLVGSILSCENVLDGPRRGKKQLESDADVRRHIGDAMSDPDGPFDRIRLKLCMGGAGNTFLGNLVDRFIWRCSSLASELKIGQGFVIRDFPGFNHEMDSGRLKLAESLPPGHGFISFVFSAEETDFKKEDKLLRAVLTALMRRGDDWSSVLFVLNRVDAFKRDREPDVSLRNALMERRARVGRLISEVWGIPTMCDVEITVLPMAAGPLFAAQMLVWGRLSELEREYFEERMERHDAMMLPDRLRETLPRSVDKWTATDRRKAYRAVRRESGLDGFVEEFKKRSAMLASNADKTGKGGFMQFFKRETASFPLFKILAEVGEKLSKLVKV